MNTKTIIWLALIVLFGVLLRLFFFSGVGASDDLLYTSYSYEISEGIYSFPPSHHGTRLGLLFPISFLYKLFGANEFSSNIFIFLSSISGMILIFYIGKTFFNERVGLLAAFLLSFFPLDVILASKLLSDLPSAFFLSFGLFLFLLAERYENKLKMRLNYIASGVFIGIAYLIRETALLVVFFFLVYSIFYKKVKLNYFFIFMGFMIIFLLESSVFYLNTGDFFYRFNSLFSNYGNVAEVSGFFGRGTFPFSLLHYPYIFFTSVQLGLFYPFIFIAIFYLVSFRKKETYPLIIWFISILLYISFGSLSLSRYVPFAGVPRYLTIVTFPALLMLAYFLVDKESIIKRTLLPSIVLILFLTSLGFIYLEDSSNNSLDNLKKISPFIKELDGPVYTDKRSKSFLEYLYGYKNEVEITEFYDWMENDDFIVPDLNQVKDAYVLVDHKLINNVQAAHPFIEYNLPKEIYDPPKEWIIVKKIGEGTGSTVLYYLP